MKKYADGGIYTAEMGKPPTDPEGVPAAKKLMPKIPKKPVPKDTVFREGMPVPQDIDGKSAPRKFSKGGVLTEKEQEAEEGRRLTDAVRSASERKVNKDFTPIKEAKTPEARQKAIELAQTLNANSDYHNLKTYNDKFDKGRSIDFSEGTKSLKDADIELARESRRGTPEKSMMQKMKSAVGMKSGGSVSSSSRRGDGIATKGKTKGTMITMRNGGKC